MPDQFERHARSRWEWGPAKNRRQQRDAAANDDPLHAKVPSKKDPDYCKPAPDHAHHEVKVFRPQFPGDNCGWGAIWSREDKGYAPWFRCFHIWQCEFCGKHYERVGTGGCPDYVTEIPRSVLRQVQEANARARRTWRKPPPDGPSHYRKPKGKR